MVSGSIWADVRIRRLQHPPPSSFRHDVLAWTDRFLPLLLDLNRLSLPTTAAGHPSDEFRHITGNAIAPKKTGLTLGTFKVQIGAKSAKSTHAPAAAASGQVLLLRQTSTAGVFARPTA